jgi:hypothetical protein
MSSSQTDQQMVNDYYNNLRQKDSNMRAALISTFNHCNLQARGLHGTEHVDKWDEAFNYMKARVEAYVPSNYQVVEHQHSLYLIGTDNAGWTLHDYVLPRLASGSIFGEEVADQSTINALAASLNNDDERTNADLYGTVTELPSTSQPTR